MAGRGAIPQKRGRIVKADPRAAKNLPLEKLDGESDLDHTERLTKELIRLSVYNRQLTAGMAGLAVLTRIRGLDQQTVRHEVQIDTRQAMRQLLAAGWSMPKTIPGLPAIEADGVDMASPALLGSGSSGPQPTEQTEGSTEHDQDANLHRSETSGIQPAGPETGPDGGDDDRGEPA